MSTSLSLDKIISIADTATLLTISKATIYNYIKSGHLPAPLRLGPRRVGYRLSDIHAWLDAQQSAARLSLSPNK